MTDAELYPNDLCTEAGARRLVTRIESYWARRGFKVRVSVIESDRVEGEKSGRFDLRSEMLNGLPRRRV